MGEITLRIEEDLLDRLKARAVGHGRTLEEEMRTILTQSVPPAESLPAETHEERTRRETREKVLAFLETQKDRPRPSPEEMVREMERISAMSPP